MPRVIIVGFEGAATLDVAGPAEVFSAAALPGGQACYQVEIAALGRREVSTTAGLRIRTRDLKTIRASRRDTVIVAGGPEHAVRAAVSDVALIRWLRAAAALVERVASVCSGAFVLGAAGLLDGKQVATHWRATERLQQLFPRARVDSKAIFVCDGSVWTSAGVTTGIDMSLAIVEQDLGRAVADAIAAELVLYLRRPGFQAQFSPVLAAQRSSSDPLHSAVNWSRANLKKADVESLARSAALSARTLHRRCTRELSTTPAKLIEKYRIEHARTLLTTTTLGMSTLSAECGFGSATHLARAFERELGMTPRAYRLLHGNGG